MRMYLCYLCTKHTQCRERAFSPAATCARSVDDRENYSSCCVCARPARQTADTHIYDTRHTTHDIVCIMVIMRSCCVCTCEKNASKKKCQPRAIVFRQFLTPFGRRSLRAYAEQKVKFTWMCRRAVSVMLRAA